MKKTLMSAMFAGLMATGCYAQTLHTPGFHVSPATAPLGGSTAMQFWDATTLLVAEKDGRVMQASTVDGSTTQILTLSTAGGADYGLLGLAIDPDFGANPYVYVYYTYATTAGGTAVEQRLSRYPWNGSAFGVEQVLQTIALLPGTQSLGGKITFGPPNAAPADQLLFLVVGDRDNHDYQALNVATGPAPDGAGCVLRINRDGTTPTGTKRGPFYDVAGSNTSLQRMYAYGIRNCFGLDFDPVSNALWDTENSETVYDEVNRLDPGTNSGWSRLMGPSTAPGAVQSGNGITDLVTFGGAGVYSEPEFSWNTAPSVAPTAIEFYRGNAFGESYGNDCFVASFTGKIYHFNMNGNRTGFDLHDSLADLVYEAGDAEEDILFASGFTILTDMTTGPDGNLYVLPIGGPVMKISRNTTAAYDWELFQ